MTTTKDSTNAAALKAARQQLARRAATGTILESDELMELYQHRHRIKSSKAEAKLILASMLHEKHEELRARESELGWFWFRDTSRRQFVDLFTGLANGRHPSAASPAVGLLAHVATKEAFTALLQFVKHADAEVAREAVKGLGRFTASQSLPSLRRIVKDSSLKGYVRRWAVVAIGKFKQEEDLQLLRGLAADPSPNVRQPVIQALAGYQCPDDVTVLRKLTRDLDENIRYQAILTIGRYGQPEDRRWLREVAQDTKHPDRSPAVQALAEFKYPADLALFRKLAGETDVGVCWNATEALGKFHHSSDVKLLKKLACQLSPGAMNTLLSYPDKVALRAIRELATEKDPGVRFSLAQCLGDWHHADAPKILRQLARMEDFYVRVAAAAALGAQGKAQDLPLLRRMSRWDSESVRREAVWAVAKFRKAEDITFLKERTQDEARSVRTVAAMALTRIMKRADLERWLNQHHEQMCFETLVEIDFALYAPRWLARTNPRAGDEVIGMELGMMRHNSPEW